MPYEHTIYAQLRSDLAQRLGDLGSVFWRNDSANGYNELSIYINEALRTWNCLTGFWRARGTINIVPNTVFYDITADLSSGASLLSDYTITDRDLIAEMQAHLLEPISPTAWTGTDMFTLEDFIEALQRIRNKFLAETGIRIALYGENVDPESLDGGRVVLGDDVIDIRRLQWVTHEGYYTNLWRTDEFAATAWSAGGWSLSTGIPIAFSTISAPPLSLQLIPPPTDSGLLEVMAILTGAALNPGTPVLIGVPDDYAWAVKWGALGSLLKSDGVARDDARSEFADAQYQLGVQLAKSARSVVHAELNGVPLLPSTLESLDAFDPGWESRLGTPNKVVTVGHNLVGVSPIPQERFSLTLDVVRKAVIPTKDTDFLSIGREHLDAIITYAEHLAAFKMGGAEFAATLPNAKAFFDHAADYRARLGDTTRYLMPQPVADQRRADAGLPA